MKKIRPVKNRWYDWLISYILEPIRKSVSGFKNEIAVFLGKTHLNKMCMVEERI